MGSSAAALALDGTDAVQADAISDDASTLVLNVRWRGASVDRHTRVSGSPLGIGTKKERGTLGQPRQARDLNNNPH